MAFGDLAERFARSLGTPKYLVTQSAFMLGWVASNLCFHLWDRYPFILLNLLLSTQAAYAAPLIMVAQNREALRNEEREQVRNQQHLDLEEKADRKLDDILTALADPSSTRPNNADES